MSLEYKILGQELVSYTDGPGEPGVSYYVSYEEVVGPSLFVAISSYNDTAYSTDGINWTISARPFANFWSSVTYGDGKFVAILQSSDITAYSRDGITWTQASIPYGNWSSVTYGGGKFVAVSIFEDKAAYSTDGITWTQGSLPAISSWSSVTYGGGKFVAVANSSNSAAYSTDGITWTATTLPTSDPWSSVTYGDGKFVAVAYYSSTGAYSTDGIAWTQTSMPSLNSWLSVTYGDGKFVAVGYDGIAAYSTDGITWTELTLPSLSQGASSVTYGDGKFVAVASLGANSYIAADYSFYSTDGINWTQTFMPANSWISVTFGQTSQLVETLNIIGGQGTTQTEEFLPITIYTVPESKQTTVTSIFVANHNNTETTYDLAVIPAGEELSLKHHIRWDMAIGAKDFENISTKITMSAGDKLVIFPSTVDTVSITAFGVEK